MGMIADLEEKFDMLDTDDIIDFSSFKTELKFLKNIILK